MKKPPQKFHLCAYCKRIVSVVEGGRIVREMPLSESGFTVKSFDLPGASHGICIECDKLERAKIRQMKAARKQGRILSNPPIWTVDRSKWSHAVKVVTHAYGLCVSKRLQAVPPEFYAVVARVYRQLGGRVRRKVRRNPKDPEFDALVEWYSAFHGKVPDAVTVAPRGKKNMPDVVAELGPLTAIEYEVTLSSGEKVTMRHTFGRQKPSLVCDADGKNLWVVGGKFRVTERGIEG